MKQFKVISFFFEILFALLSINICNATSLSNSFSGTWCSIENNKKQAFTLIINKHSDLYKGGYFAVALGGQRIDDNEKAFSFKAVKTNTIKTKITAGITGKIGMVYLKLLNKNKLEWVILEAPGGDFYVPIKAILNKCPS